MPNDFPGMIPTTMVDDCDFSHACNFCDEQPSCRLDKKNHDDQLVKRRLSQIDHVLLVMSNKGGVGKSTTAANLAVALANSGSTTGLADADIHGPNVPRLFGLQNQRVRVHKEGIETPVYKIPNSDHSLRVGSLGFFLPDNDTPVVWRDAHKYQYIQHMLGSFNWGKLDYLVIDMPPGTGNELITVTGALEGRSHGVLLVSTSDSLTLQDSLKAARYCRDDKIPLLGLVENQAGMICPHCNNEIELFPQSPQMEEFEKFGVRTLARVPFAQEIAQAAEIAQPFATHPETALGTLFHDLASTCKASLAGP